MALSKGPSHGIKASNQKNRNMFEEERHDCNGLNASQYLHQAGFQFTILKYAGS